MLSDEEREAIEGLFHLAHINTYLDLEKEDVVKISRTLIAKWKDKTEILLNLIEKQQKEIEELRNEVMEKELIIDGMKEDRRIAVEEIQEQYYVSKDKIKAKIEEYEKMKEATKTDTTYYGEKRRSVIEALIAVLQSLLEKE